MLCAKRNTDGKTVSAYLELKANGPYVCLDCHEEVILKRGRNRINHFAHANPIACKFAEGESEVHRRCKMEIFEALKNEPGVSNLCLERPIGNVRPDICATIRGVPVAIGQVTQCGAWPETNGRLNARIQSLDPFDGSGAKTLIIDNCRVMEVCYIITYLWRSNTNIEIPKEQAH